MLPAVGFVPLLLVLGAPQVSRGGSPPSSSSSSSSSPPAGEEGSAAGPPLCDYRRCRHLQPPCAELRRAAACLCPGLSGPGTPPEPPELAAVTVTAAGATLRWCAPASVVLEYQVLVGTPEKSPVPDGPVLPASFRAAAVGGLRPDTPYVFCVVARNGAGVSPVVPAGALGGPCRAVRTPPRPGRILPAAAAVAGGLGVAGGSALVWHCLRRRRRRGSPAPHDPVRGDGDRDPPGSSAVGQGL